MTDAQFQAWLDSHDAEPVTLYRLGAWSASAGGEVVRRLSNRAYKRADAATPYAAAIAADLVASEAITADGKGRVSAGEVKIWNIDGERTSWLGDVFCNRDIEVLLGDLRWPESDFRRMFLGKIEDVSSSASSPDTEPMLIVKVRDAMDRLNTPVTELTMGDGSIHPTTFGECPNITPKHAGAGALSGEYTYHPTATEGTIRAAVDGMTREAVQDLPSSGSIIYQTAIGPGAVTLSVQGDKTGGVYRRTIAQIVRLLVQSYGDPADRFTDAEIDLDNFTAFDGAHPYAVGLYLTDRTLVIDACARLAASVRAQLVPSMTGKLRLLRARVPGSATGAITAGQYQTGTLVQAVRHKVVAAVNLGYCRNYTPQPSLVTRLAPELKAILAQEWRAVQRVNETTVARYRMTRVAAMAETCLLNKEDASVEAYARLDEDSTQRYTYRITGTRSLLLQTLGQGVVLYGNEFDLQNGKIGQIRSREINFDYRNLTVNTEITI